MQIHDNSGKLIGEINNIVASDGTRIVTNTVYSSTGRVLIQHVSTRDNQGKSADRDFFGGKVQP
jgi:hypothetical protein